jgi:hypothetical protein
MPLRIRIPSIGTTGAPPSTTLAWIKVAGVWKQATVHIKVAGVWKTANPKIKISGVWR